MKKFALSAIFVAAFAAYVLYQYFGNSSTAFVAIAPVSTSTDSEVSVPKDDKASTASAGSDNPPNAYLNGPPTETAPPPTSSAPTQSTPTQSASMPMSMPAMPMHSSQFADGTYTGNSVYVYYGNVQVQAVISGGKLTTINFLEYPNDRSTSRYISSVALPILRSEAIQSQSASVSTVSGASDTSEGFRESLSAALSQAKNG